MKELTLTQQYAVVALNGLESLHPSMAKDAVLRAIAAAQILEALLVTEEECDFETFLPKLNEAVESAKNLKKKNAKEMEKEISGLLEADGLMEQVHDILGCDLDYYTSGIELKAYRSEENTYLRLREGLRAEVLEDGEISMESILLLWLHRESGCIHDLFSVAEQNKVQERMIDMGSKSDIYRSLWEAEFHSALESFVGKFLRVKKNLFKNPYLEGVNLIFPYIERRNSIFIDGVVFGTNVSERRSMAMEHLSKMGHHVEEVKNGSETLLKVDNVYYRVFPTTRTCSKVPIQGITILPVYW